MKKLLGLMAIAVGLSTSVLVMATDKNSVPAADNARIKAAIEAKVHQSRPEIMIESVAASPVDGLYAVKFANGPVVYATADGSYFVMGDLFAIQPEGFVNLAEQQREAARAAILADLDVSNMIVFSPAEKPVKASVYVFTDVDCFYCQKLHKEMADINQLGIEVRYLAYPRAGIGSDSYKKIASAWCAKDPNAALTKLKARQSIPTTVCPGNPVADDYKLGQQLGVTGTPALFTTDGRLMPGYMPALQLARALGVAVDPVLASQLAAKQAPAAR